MRSIILLLCFVISPVIAVAQDSTSVMRRVAFGVMIDAADPFFGEATCDVQGNCELIDHKNPNIRLTIDGSRNGYDRTRLHVECGVVPCFAHAETRDIDLRKTGERLNFEISEGQSSIVNDALIHYGQHIGKIVVRY